MEADTKQKPYQQVLLDRCQEWWTKYEASVRGDQLVKFDWPKILCDFVKQVALESFKNGVTVGKRKRTSYGREQAYPRRQGHDEA